MESELLQRSGIAQRCRDQLRIANQPAPDFTIRTTRYKHGVIAEIMGQRPDQHGRIHRRRIKSVPASRAAAPTPTASLSPFREAA